VSKPIQIAVALSRTPGEQYGEQIYLVLLDDGRLFEFFGTAGWNEVKGPWLSTPDNGKPEEK
jgi:hypothetical protein